MMAVMIEDNYIDCCLIMTLCPGNEDKRTMDMMCCTVIFKIVNYIVFSFCHHFLFV